MQEFPWLFKKFRDDLERKEALQSLQRVEELIIAAYATMSNKDARTLHKQWVTRKKAIVNREDVKQETVFQRLRKRDKGTLFDRFKKRMRK